MNLLVDSSLSRCMHEPFIAVLLQTVKEAMEAYLTSERVKWVLHPGPVRWSCVCPEVLDC